ncbi:hypothetical protein CSAL01_02296 [Colletotrichum salicis]|uniref:Vacuolar ATPase assembly protein VMA22 n=1 Tax=Colletotrichum salicis TaxID=1209931 RepID=A0A135V2N5_9PEZI|nr:hypothetical protein CSAL01_02296 [Colletotrichum salicis]
METDHIDSLLERYLLLLDEYTALRERLSGTQAGMYQNIARANFSAERGVRYGPDYYDQRMRASRTLEVAVNDRGVPRFEVVKAADDGDAVTEPKAEAAAKSGDVDEAPGMESEGVTSSVGEETGREAEKEGGTEEEKEETKQKKKKKNKKKSNDPLRWFGILAPMPLRQAQTLSVQAVQDIVPRLVSVDAEMKDIEIEVRRARKRRAKAEAAEMKRNDVDEGGEAVRREVQAPVAAV